MTNQEKKLKFVEDIRILSKIEDRKELQEKTKEIMEKWGIGADLFKKKKHQIAKEFKIKFCIGRGRPRKLGF